MLDARPKTTRAEVSDHDWMETAWLLRYELTDIFEQMIIAIRDRLSRRVESLNTPDESSAQSGQTAAEDEEESAI
jgi:hypothetical protein